MNIFNDNNMKTTFLLRDFLNLNYLSQFRGNSFFHLFWKEN